MPVGCQDTDLKTRCSSNRYQLGEVLTFQRCLNFGRCIQNHPDTSKATLQDNLRYKMSHVAEEHRYTKFGRMDQLNREAMHRNLKGNADGQAQQ